MDRESPPLIKCLPGITSIISKPLIDLESFESDANTWTLGYHFMYKNWTEYHEIFRYGRYVIILVGCLTGWLLYRFGSELYGRNGGVLALFLYVFNPNIIAHSCLNTIDIGASCAVLFSVYCLWRYLKKKALTSAVIAGIALGLAQLSKFSALILYPIFIVIILISAIKKTNSGYCLSNHFKVIILRGIRILSFWKDYMYLAGIFLVSLIVINIGYLFSGSFSPLGEFHFLSEPMQHLSSMLWNALPIPFPYDFISGFDSQLAISAGDNPFYTNFLMGEHSMKGWWYYYIIAFMVKNPLALLIILILTIIAFLKTGAKSIDRNALICIGLPIAAFFIFFSFFTHINIGIRLLLPVFPLIFLSAGYLIKVDFFKARTGQFVMAVLLLAYSIPNIFIFPNYLSYFNIISGGPEQGYRWVIDSNLDWGQDLPGLKKYLRTNGFDKVRLGYFGRVDPRIYGIDYELVKKEPETGIYAISINYLAGRPYYLLDAQNKALVYADLKYFEKYRAFEPVDIINNTIWIFDIKNEDLKK